MYAGVPLSPLKARHFPRVRGKLTLRKKKLLVFIILNTFLRLTYAEFFAPSDNLFFLLLPFLFCPPLKNDGRVVSVSP